MSDVVAQACDYLGYEDNYEGILYHIYERARYFVPWRHIERFADGVVTVVQQRTPVSKQMVRRVWNEVCLNLGVKSIHRCAHCNTQKITRHLSCPLCPRLLSKRGTLAQSKSYTCFNIREQLTDLLTRCAPQIIVSRLAIHNGVSLFRDDDIRSKPAFLSKIETRQDFVVNQEVILPAVIHFDGTKYDKKSVGHDWPVSIALTDLDVFDRFSLENIIFAGCYSAYKNPQSSDWDRLMHAMRRELQSLEIAGVAMVFLGVQYTFHLKLCFPLVDLQALSIGFNFTAGGYKACPLCYVTGQHLNGSVRYGVHPGVPRTRIASVINMILARHGYRGHSHLAYVLGVDSYVLDILHNGPEGGFKRWLEVLCGKRSVRGGALLKIPAATLALADGLSGSIKFPTYGIGRLRPLTECCGSVSAKERLSAIFIQLLVVLTSSPCPSCEGEACILMILLNHRILMEREVTDAELNLVADNLRSLRDLYLDIFGNGWNTLKLHQYFAHLPDQLLEFGNLTDFDTTNFENLMGQLKRDGSVRATNGYLLSSFERVFVYSNVKRELCAPGVRFDSPSLNRIAEEYSNVRGASNGRKISNQTIIPVNSFLTANQVQMDQVCQDLLLQIPNATFVKRILWCKNAISVARHWDAADLSEQNHIAVLSNGSWHYDFMESMRNTTAVPANRRGRGGARPDVVGNSARRNVAGGAPFTLPGNFRNIDQALRDAPPQDAEDLWAALGQQWVLPTANDAYAVWLDEALEYRMKIYFCTLLRQIYELHAALRDFQSSVGQGSGRNGGGEGEIWKNWIFDPSLYQDEDVVNPHDEDLREVIPLYVARAVIRGRKISKYPNDVNGYLYGILRMVFTDESKFVKFADFTPSSNNGLPHHLIEEIAKCAVGCTRTRDGSKINSVHVKNFFMSSLQAVLKNDRKSDRKGCPFTEAEYDQVMQSEGRQPLPAPRTVSSPNVFSQARPVQPEPNDEYCEVLDDSGRMGDHKTVDPRNEAMTRATGTGSEASVDGNGSTPSGLGQEIFVVEEHLVRKRSRAVRRLNVATSGDNGAEMIRPGAIKCEVNRRQTEKRAAEVSVERRRETLFSGEQQANNGFNPASAPKYQMRAPPSQLDDSQAPSDSDPASHQARQVAARSLSSNKQYVIHQSHPTTVPLTIPAQGPPVTPPRMSVQGIPVAPSRMPTASTAILDAPPVLSPRTPVRRQASPTPGAVPTAATSTPAFSAPRRDHFAPMQRIPAPPGVDEDVYNAQIRSAWKVAGETYGSDGRPRQ